MRLAGITGHIRATFSGAATRSFPSDDDRASPARRRDLVPVDPGLPAGDAGFMSRRPLAPFLAQLIATRQDAPQTRARRRAGIEVAVAEYAEAEAAPHVHAPLGARPIRSM